MTKDVFVLPKQKVAFSFAGRTTELGGKKRSASPTFS